MLLLIFLFFIVLYNYTLLDQVSAYLTRATLRIINTYKTLFFFLIYLFCSTNVIGCDTTPTIIPSNVTDNGDGTYYMDISACIGSGGSADGFDLYFNNDINILGTTVTEVTSSTGNVATVNVSNGMWVAYFEDFNTNGTYFENGVWGLDCIDFGITVDEDPEGATICSAGINEDCLGFTQENEFITCGAIPGPCQPNYSIINNGTIDSSVLNSGQNCNFAPFNDEIIELTVPCGGDYNFSLTQDQSMGWPGESWLTIATGCCSGAIEQTSSFGFLDSIISIETNLDPGIYYVIVDVASDNFTPGDYILDISSDDMCMGCIYSSACNYNPEALFDDGSCEWFSCYGCTNPNACNYGGEDITIDDGSCEYVDGICELCINSIVIGNDSDGDGVCNSEDMCEGFDDAIDADSDLIPDECDDCPNDPYNDIDNDGLCYDEEIFGCTYLKACNYDPDATEDDGSCLFEFLEDSCSGCTDTLACNFAPNATEDDGSCEYESCVGCTDYNACNYEADNTNDDGSCVYPNICESCDSDLSCIGCTDPLACNYDSEATIDSNLCEYPIFGFDCYGNPTGEDPDSVFCVGEEVEVVLSVSEFNESNDSFIDANIYSDDSYGGVIDMGFDFHFYGNSYNQLVLSSNNYLSFNTDFAGGYSGWAIDLPIPQNDTLFTSGYGPLNSILAPWHDTNPGVSGQIAYTVIGESPNRIFVASFCGIPMFSCTNWNSGAQIKLYESSNIIETHIMEKPLCSTWNDGAAIHGLQNSDGTIAEIVTGPDGITRNFPNQWEASQEAWRFIPSGDDNYTIEYINFSPTIAAEEIIWQDQYGNVISVGDTIVTITENSSFNAISSYCDSVDFVIKNIDILFESCDGCMEEDACNYDPNATEENGSCIYPDDPCTTDVVISNPSFEIDSISGGGCFSAPSPWINCMTYISSNGTIETTTPDTQPGCYFVETVPSEGDNYIGIGHILNYDTINPTMGVDQWQEGISQQLNSPMIANTAYTFNIDLANALTADPWSGSGTTSTIGEIRVFGGFDSCSEEELLWSSGLIENNQWETYIVEFTPTNNYTYILFQAFNPGDELNTSYTLMDNMSNITPVEDLETFINDDCECLPYIYGCTDSSACNYDEFADEDDGSCWYAEPGYDCTGELCDVSFTMTAMLNCPPDLSMLMVDGLTAYGGTPPYNYTWEFDGEIIADGPDETFIMVEFAEPGNTYIYTLTVTDANNCELSSIYPIYNYMCTGCTDIEACNYSPEANTDDGSCEYPEANFDCDGVCININENCGYESYIIDVMTGQVSVVWSGSIDANCDCIENGCTDSAACNYYPEADIDDGSCYYPGDSYAGDIILDASGGVAVINECGELSSNCECCYVETYLISSEGGVEIIMDYICGCTDPLACNYDPEAQEDNDSCLYSPDPDCPGTDLEEGQIHKEIVKVVDIIGQEISPETRNMTLLYIYNDGSMEVKHLLK